MKSMTLCGKGKMKKDIHAKNYRDVAFKDITADKIFVLKSTVSTTETIKHEGKEYPLFTVDTSSASHPFYTGDRQSSKSTGRVERFNRRIKVNDKK